MKLAPPGSGLPIIERLFIKNILIPPLRIVVTWNMITFLITRELKIIDNLLNSIDKKLLSKKVLINRTFAIEDDTRQFSVNMVLEHLEIAGSKVKEIIDSLSQEKDFQEEVKIENVKPKLNDENQYESFKIFYNDYVLFINKLNKRQSIKKKKHPWFIEFNNFDWHMFMYMHTFIHRRQIKAIIKNININF